MTAEPRRVRAASGHHRPAPEVIAEARARLRHLFESHKRSTGNIVIEPEVLAKEVLMSVTEVWAVVDRHEKDVEMLRTQVAELNQAVNRLWKGSSE